MKPEEIKVFISNRASTCDECGEDLGRGAWITLVRDKGALCLSCSDMDHLVFLASGNAALTRRSRKHSILCAVVLKWSRARKRYERQGLLVEEKALLKAEEECLEDHEARVRRRERAAERRAVMDRQYVRRFADRILEMFPRCPVNRELVIAEHACLKYSGRIGRTGAAKNLDPEAVRLAVIAHIRHAETSYDKLLGAGNERWEARNQVDEDVRLTLVQWSAPT